MTQTHLPPTRGAIESPLVFSSTALPNSVASVIPDLQITRHGEGFGVKAPQMDEEAFKTYKELVLRLRGRWLPRQGHWFPYNPIDLFQSVLEVGKLPVKNPFSLFETPDETIDDLLELIDCPQDFPEHDSYETEWRFLEPSAGPGAIARKIRQRCSKATLDVVEIDPFNQEILRRQGFNLIASNFLTDPVPEGNYDFILMNPEFKGTRYVDHIQRAYRCLKPYGIIGAIVPESLLFTSIKNAEDLRTLVAETGCWESFGAPFKEVKVKVLGLKIQRVSEAVLTKKWQPTEDGYESQYHRNIEFALDASPEWHNVLCQARQLHSTHQQRFLANHLDAIVARFIQKEYCCFLYNDIVKQQLLRSAIKTLHRQ